MLTSCPQVRGRPTPAAVPRSRLATFNPPACYRSRRRLGLGSSSRAIWTKSKLPCTMGGDGPHNSPSRRRVACCPDQCSEAQSTIELHPHSALPSAARLRFLICECSCALEALSFATRSKSAMSNKPRSKWMDQHLETKTLSACVNEEPVLQFRL